MAESPNRCRWCRRLRPLADWARKECHSTFQASPSHFVTLPHSGHRPCGERHHAHFAIVRGPSHGPPRHHPRGAPVTFCLRAAAPAIFVIRRVRRPQVPRTRSGRNRVQPDKAVRSPGPLAWPPDDRSSHPRCSTPPWVTGKENAFAEQSQMDCSNRTPAPTEHSIINTC